MATKVKHAKWNLHGDSRVKGHYKRAWHRTARHDRSYLYKEDYLNPKLKFYGFLD